MFSAGLVIATPVIVSAAEAIADEEAKPYDGTYNGTYSGTVYSNGANGNGVNGNGARAYNGTYNNGVYSNGTIGYNGYNGYNGHYGQNGYNGYPNGSTALTQSTRRGYITKFIREGGTEYGRIQGIEMREYPNDSPIIFHISESTYLVEGTTGFPLALENLTHYDRVAVVYGPMLALSEPPQGHALMVFKLGEYEWPPDFGRVEAIDTRDGIKVVTLHGGALQMDIAHDTPISPFLTRNIATIDNIQVGSELLLWQGGDSWRSTYPVREGAAGRVVILSPGSTNSGYNGHNGYNGYNSYNDYPNGNNGGVSVITGNGGLADEEAIALPLFQYGYCRCLVDSPAS